MKPFWKTYTFWISVCTWLATLGGQYAGIVPAPYGTILGNIVAVVYMATRCLQKRQAGVPWKGILFTSEFLVTGATASIDLLESLSKIPALPPKVLALVSVAIVALGTLLHTLSSSVAQSGVPVAPASEAVTAVNRTDPASSGAELLRKRRAAGTLLREADEQAIQAAVRRQANLPNTEGSSPATPVSIPDPNKETT